MNNIDNLIENLNKEQKEAVLSTEGPNLIVAGAGSGKTRVLTTRLIHIINKKRFTILADSGDNPTAGGVGSRIDVLEHVFKNKIQNTLFAGIFNKKIFRELKNKKKQNSHK